MFKDLLKFEVNRTFVQAIGFYLFYVILAALICYIVGAVSAIVLQLAKDFHYESVGIICAIIYCPMLSLIILIKKKLYTSPVAIVLFLLTFIGVLLMGCLLGCIVPAILSTFDSKADNN